MSPFSRGIPVDFARHFPPRAVFTQHQLGRNPPVRGDYFVELPARAQGESLGHWKVWRVTIGHDGNGHVIDGGITLAADVLSHSGPRAGCTHAPLDTVRESIWAGGTYHEHHRTPAEPTTKRIDAEWLTAEAAKIFAESAGLGVPPAWDISECLERRALPPGDIARQLFEHQTTLVPQRAWSTAEMRFRVVADGSLMGDLICKGWLTSDGRVDTLWEELRGALAYYARPARVLLQDLQTQVSRTVEVLG